MENRHLYGAGIYFIKKNIIMTKLEKEIERLVKYCDERGFSNLTTCQHPNWDKEIWDNKEYIIDQMIVRGYNVQTQSQYGAIDIMVKKELPK